VHGHRDDVTFILIDSKREAAISGSFDRDIRCWDLRVGVYHNLNLDGKSVNVCCDSLMFAVSQTGQIRWWVEGSVVATDGEALEQEAFQKFIQDTRCTNPARLCGSVRSGHDLTH
jgi:hypothetical protein